MSYRTAVLLATHNRVGKTTQCLEALHQLEDACASLQVVLCDAGSTDGTPEVVRRRFPDVTVLDASQELFWNGGMHRAFEHALVSDYDAYLWLNDDTILDSHALRTLLAVWQDPRVRAHHPAIVVGAVRDPVTGAVSYGGVHRPHRARPLLFELALPVEQPRPVTTMNGNCVLIPRDVVQRIGVLDPAFTHGMGDFDYGLRARAAGVTVWSTPGTVGACPRNPQSAPPSSLQGHVAQLTGPKGLPPRQWVLFARRWAGPLWPLYAASPFVRRTVSWAKAGHWRGAQRAQG